MLAPNHVSAPDTFTFLDAYSKEHVTLEKNVFTGAWKHPKIGYDVCGAPTYTYENGQPDSATGPICLRPAGWGTDHKGAGRCRTHRGTYAQFQAPALRVLNDLEARKALQSLGRPIDVDPIEALLHLVREAAGNVAFLGGRVADLGYAIVGDVMSLTREGLPIATAEDARAIVKIYGEERDRLARVAKLAIDAGIAEREVKLAEDQAAMMGKVFRAALARLGLDAVKESIAMGFLVEELRRVEQKTFEGHAVVVR